MPSLLILGTMVDPHIERVVAELNRRGNVDISVLDFLDESGSFSFSVDETGEWSITVNDKPIFGNYLVWDRSKLIYGTEFYVKGDIEGQGFAAEEWRALYRLVSGIHDDRTVNALRLRASLLKPHQQILAAKAGFKVPRSLVTNSKTEVCEFSRQFGAGVIMKSLSGQKVRPPFERDYNPYNVLTMRVPPEDIASADPEEIRYCPHFIQHEIMKDFELRVVVVADRIIPFKVDSQRSKVSQVDWRKGVPLVEFSRSNLEPLLERRVAKFMELSGLFCGSLDIIVDKKGEYWFLEINPEGAWGWLDDLVEGEVTMAFADGFEKRLGIAPPPVSSLASPLESA